MVFDNGLIIHNSTILERTMAPKKTATRSRQAIKRKYRKHQKPVAPETSSTDEVKCARRWRWYSLVRLVVLLLLLIAFWKTIPGMVREMRARSKASFRDLVISRKFYDTRLVPDTINDISANSTLQPLTSDKIGLIASFLEDVFHDYRRSDTNAPPFKHASSLRLLSDDGSELERVFMEMLHSLICEEYFDDVVHVVEFDGGYEKIEEALKRRKDEYQYNPVLFVVRNADGPDKGGFSMNFKDLIYTNPIKGLYPYENVGFVFLGGKMDPCGGDVARYDIQTNKWQKATASRIGAAFAWCQK